MSWSTTSTRFFNTSRDGDSTTSLGSLFQCLTTVSVKKFFLISNLNFPWHNLRPLPLILSLVTWDHRPPPASLQLPVLSDNKGNATTISNNNEYAKQMIYNKIFSPPNDWFAASSWAAITESRNCRFHKTPEKDKTLRKVQTPGQERICTHRREKSRFLPPSQPHS